jgi:hypothetical protein
MNVRGKECGGPYGWNLPDWQGTDWSEDEEADGEGDGPENNHTRDPQQGKPDESRKEWRPRLIAHQ